MKPFEWKEFVCEWNDLSLVAGDDGSWSVLTPEGDYCGWRNQVKGSDFKDAQLRAQAAAMVLHKLRTKPDEHGRPDRTNSQ